MSAQTASRKRARPAARIGEILAEKRNLPPMISVSSHEPLIQAIRLMHVYNISQLPVLDDERVVGMVSEELVLARLYHGAEFLSEPVSLAMGPLLPRLDEDADVAEAYRLFTSGVQGILVTREKRVLGLITRSDLIAFWSLGKVPHPYQI